MVDVRDPANIAVTGIIPSAINVTLSTLTYKTDHEVHPEWRDPNFQDFAADHHHLRDQQDGCTCWKALEGYGIYQCAHPGERHGCMERGGLSNQYTVNP